MLPGTADKTTSTTPAATAASAEPLQHGHDGALYRAARLQCLRLAGLPPGSTAPVDAAPLLLDGMFTGRFRRPLQRVDWRGAEGEE